MIDKAYFNSTLRYGVDIHSISGGSTYKKFAATRPPPPTENSVLIYVFTEKRPRWRSAPSQ